MKSTQKKIVGLSLLSMLMITSFNNCAQSGFQTLEVASQNASGGASGQNGSDPAASGPTGVELYNTNCAVCHGELATSSKLGKTADDIRTALATQVMMKHLQGLTSVEIEKIAQALNGMTTPPPGPNPNPSPNPGPGPSPTPGPAPMPGPTPMPGPSPMILPSQTKPVVGNRYMVQSNLQEIFLASSNRDTSDTAIDAVISNLVATRPEAFGGNCTRYDAGCSKTNCGPYASGDCAGKLDASVNAQPLPTFSTVSKGYMIRTCEEILAVNKAISNVLGKVGLTVNSPINQTNVLAVMKFMYRERPVDMTSANELVKVADLAKSKAMTVTDQWKYVVLPICASSAQDLL